MNFNINMLLALFLPVHFQKYYQSFINTGYNLINDHLRVEPIFSVCVIIIMNNEIAPFIVRIKWPGCVCVWGGGMRACVFVCVIVCVCAHMCARTCVGVRVCTCARVRVGARISASWINTINFPNFYVAIPL